MKMRRNLKGSEGLKRKFKNKVVESSKPTNKKIVFKALVELVALSFIYAAGYLSVQNQFFSFVIFIMWLGITSQIIVNTMDQINIDVTKM